MARRHQQRAAAVAIAVGGLAVVTALALAAWQIAKDTVLQDRALTRCGMTPPPDLDPHYAARAQARGIRVTWHTFGYECEYTREDGTVFYLPPASY